MKPAKASAASAEGAPTMIIPNGTKIEVDGHGQLSIRTPGNLVIQNSGSYGTIESAAGSIRIEADVQLEAVHIRCAETCYIQGDVTAWKVEARSIELEESARAHIILQESERLHIGREARMVGNFSSERELFLLFSRFARQLRQVPFFRTGNGGDEGAELSSELLSQSEERRLHSPSPDRVAPGSRTSAAPSEPVELDDSLFFAQVLLEREASRPGNGPSTQEALQRLVTLLRQRDLEGLRASRERLFSDIVEPSEDVRRARALVVAWFGE